MELPTIEELKKYGRPTFHAHEIQIHISATKWVTINWSQITKLVFISRGVDTLKLAEIMRLFGCPPDFGFYDTQGNLERCTYGISGHNYDELMEYSRLGQVSANAETFHLALKDLTEEFRDNLPSKEIVRVLLEHIVEYNK